MTGALRIALARVYDDPGPVRGTRLLVDRVWPRGVTRTALGRTGHALAASANATAIYLVRLAVVLARLGVGIWPVRAGGHALSGPLWTAAFSRLVAFFGRVLFTARPER